MTPQTYYRRSLLLPVVVPLLPIPFLLVYSWSGAPDPPRAIAMALLLVGGSLFFGGIPYALCAILLAIAIRHSSLRTIRIVSCLTPPGFALIMWLLAGGLMGDPNGAAVFAGCAIVLGYGYVVLAHIGYAILLNRGSIELPTRPRVARPTLSTERSPSRGTSR